MQVLNCHAKINEAAQKDATSWYNYQLVQLYNDSLPISERSSHFECLLFTEEWIDYSSAKMEDLCSEEMLAVIDSVFIAMPKNVVCVVGVPLSLVLSKH